MRGLVKLGIFPMSSQLGSGDQEKPVDEEWAKTLENLVRILSGYGKLRFVPFYPLKKHGESEFNTPRRWRAVLGLEEIQYLPEDVDDPVREVGLGRAAHEVWHVVHSRPELIFDEAELSNSLAFQALWAAIEDPRVNWLGLRQHPGAREWLDAALNRDYEKVSDPAEGNRFRAETPIHIQFNHALIYEWFTGRPDPRVEDERVKAALAKAHPAIRRAYFEPNAARSFQIIKNDVWPIYKELVDEAYDDAQKQEQGGQGQDGQEGEDSEESDGQPGGQGKPGSKSAKQKAKEDAAKRAKDKMQKAEKDFRDKHGSKMVEAPEKMSQAEKERMKKEMDKLRKKMGQKQQGQKQEGDKQDGEAQDADGEGDGEGEGEPQSAEKRAKQRERLSKSERDQLTDSSPVDEDEAQGKYEDYLKRVQQHVPIMKAQFLQILKRKIRRRVIRNRDSGDFDPEALARIPGGDRDVFKESMIANKTMYRISLLIDISGSMGGEKKERAIEGAVMMMEALDKLPGVQYEIVAFDDKPYVVKAYNERSTPNVKSEAVRALLKNGGSTQSGLAVKEALERIRMGRGDKLMIMVNDGDPDNNFSKEDFRRMIAEAKEVDVHGVGLGSDAQLVLDLFPPGRGWWLKDAAEFARRLRSILATKIK